MQQQFTQDHQHCLQGCPRKTVTQDSLSLGFQSRKSGHPYHLEGQGFGKKRVTASNFELFLKKKRCQHSETSFSGCSMTREPDEMLLRKMDRGISLVAQWLRIRLPIQGTRVRSLVREDPTCCVTTKPMHHNY